MHLSARFYTNQGRIEYDFHPVSGIHSVWTEWAGTTRGSADQVAAKLLAWRGNKDVEELIAWLRGL